MCTYLLYVQKDGKYLRLCVFKSFNPHVCATKHFLYEKVFRKDISCLICRQLCLLAVRFPLLSGTKTGRRFFLIPQIILSFFTSDFTFTFHLRFYFQFSPQILLSLFSSEFTFTVHLRFYFHFSPQTLFSLFTSDFIFTFHHYLIFYFFQVDVINMSINFSPLPHILLFQVDDIKMSVIIDSGGSADGSETNDKLVRINLR